MPSWLVTLNCKKISLNSDIDLIKAMIDVLDYPLNEGVHREL